MLVLKMKVNGYSEQFPRSDYDPDTITFLEENGFVTGGYGLLRKEYRQLGSLVRKNSILKLIIYPNEKGRNFIQKTYGKCEIEDYTLEVALMKKESLEIIISYGNMILKNIIPILNYSSATGYKISSELKIAPIIFYDRRKLIIIGERKNKSILMDENKIKYHHDKDHYDLMKMAYELDSDSKNVFCEEMCKEEK